MLLRESVGAFGPGRKRKTEPANRLSPNLFRMHKPRPNHHEYVEVLRRMTPAQRLAKAFELSEMTKRVFRQGLRKQFPGPSEEDFHQLYLERLAKCHNRNY
jgi:hypothetical protein